MSKGFDYSGLMSLDMLIEGLDRADRTTMRDRSTLQHLRELYEWRRRAAAYREAEAKWSSISQSSDSWKEQEPDWTAYMRAQTALLEFRP